MKQITTSEFNDLVENSKTPILVDFYANWCMPCKMMAPVLEDLEDECSGLVNIYKVNVDDEMNLAVRFNIDSIPCLLYFVDGKLKQRFIGLQDKETLKGVILNA